VLVESTSTDLYFKATDKYLGDQKAAYYQFLRFTISYTSAQQAVLDYTERYVVLKGHQLNYELW